MGTCEGRGWNCGWKKLLVRYGSSGRILPREVRKFNDWYWPNDQGQYCKKCLVSGDWHKMGALVRVNIQRVNHTKVQPIKQCTPRYCIHHTSKRLMASICIYLYIYISIYLYIYIYRERESWLFSSKYRSLNKYWSFAVSYYIVHDYVSGRCFIPIDIIITPSFIITILYWKILVTLCTQWTEVKLIDVWYCVTLT